MSVCSRVVNSLPLFVLFCGMVTAQGPHIDKVDPPEWFATLPAPMLLLHGSGLDSDGGTGAEGRDVAEWALGGGLAGIGVGGSGTLHLAASTGAGSAAFTYRVLPRRAAGEVAGGFSAADVMVCLMPDRFADGMREMIVCRVLRRPIEV